MNNKYDEMVGDRIRTARRNNKMTMKELGKKIGMHESTISRYEKGELSLDVTQVKQFASALGVSSAYLCGWDKNSTTERDIKRWFDIVGELNFSDEEFDELANYAKYIVSKRK